MSAYLSTYVTMPMNLAKNDMTTIEKIQKWLAKEPKDDETIKEGALLLLTIDRNKFYYQRVCKAPQYYAKHVIYKLENRLKMRLDNITEQKVESMVAKEMPTAKAIMEAKPVADDAEEESEEESQDGYQRKGKRADHDRLPKKIQDNWWTCAELWHKIKQTYNSLLQMHNARPCDRYDQVQLLISMDKRYRKLMNEYDDYKIEE